MAGPGPIALALLSALAALALPTGAAAMEAPARSGGVADPVAFVRERFAVYATGQVPQDRTDGLWSARMRSLLDRLDEAEGGEQRINFDTWVNAQDFAISDVLVVLERDGRDRRIVLARWRNFGRADSSRFHFVRRHGRWFLDDIVSRTSGWTLSALLRDAARQ